MSKITNLFVQLIIVVALFQIIGCASTRVNPNKLPKDIKLSKGLEIPSDAALSIYIPANSLKSQFYLKYGGRVEPGNALKQALEAVSSKFFENSKLVGINKERKFGLLLDLEPEWDFKSGKTILKLKYRLYDTNMKLILEAEKEHKATISYQDPTGSFFNAATRSLQNMYVSILNKLKPTSSLYAAINDESSIPPEVLADLEKPVSSGTAFKINKDGELLTAAHVIRDCLVVKAQFEENIYPVSTKSSSDLLDIAVLKSDINSDKFLMFRKEDKLELGEKVTTVSYPLKGLLDASPNLTVGNVSSQKALRGSLGLYQFSAPIQPGSSGGAIVSENGEVIGIVSGTLNTKSLIEKGVVPQNINFALAPKVITKFLDKNDISYQRNTKKNKSKNNNTKALESTVQLTCYQ
ncbi:MAG: serine protease [Kangiellaceae bacterium]|nr:serine protease [Kangiellaceae bacterium]